MSKGNLLLSLCHILCKLLFIFSPRAVRQLQTHPFLDQARYFTTNWHQYWRICTKTNWIKWISWTENCGRQLPFYQYYPNYSGKRPKIYWQGITCHMCICTECKRHKNSFNEFYLHNHSLLKIIYILIFWTETTVFRWNSSDVGCNIRQN